MTDTKFHIEDWMNYYKARIDEDNLKEVIDFEDFCTCKAVRFDDNTLHADLDSGLATFVEFTIVDDETSQEEEAWGEVNVEFAYSVDYKLGDISDRIEEFEEALNEAIETGESTFEIEVPFVASEAYKLEMGDIEIYDEHGSRDAISREVARLVEQGLAHSNSTAQTGDFVQPPSDKEVKFICKIPTN